MVSYSLSLQKLMCSVMLCNTLHVSLHIAICVEKSIKTKPLAGPGIPLPLKSANLHCFMSFMGELSDIGIRLNSCISDTHTGCSGQWEGSGVPSFPFFRDKGTTHLIYNS